MEIRFKEQYLEDLYKNGRTADKSHRFQPEVIRKYHDCVDMLRAAPDVRMLMQRRSLHFEHLKGKLLGQSSVRVDGRYRISFTVTTEGDTTITTICNILKLSNHYD
jgi:proteic killer suppression protein